MIPYKKYRMKKTMTGRDVLSVRKATVIATRTLFKSIGVSKLISRVKSCR